MMPKLTHDDHLAEDATWQVSVFSFSFRFTIFNRISFLLFLYLLW